MARSASTARRAAGQPGVRLLERTADLLASSWPDAALEARLAAATIAIRRGRRNDGPLMAHDIEALDRTPDASRPRHS